MLHFIFSRGYRPFFLLAAGSAIAAMLHWLYFFSTVVPTERWPALTLHAHEMIYGTVVSAIAGFLLTAVPNWTSTEPVTGRPLVGLLGVWLAGRVAMLLSSSIDPMWVMAIDVSFLPLLAVAVGVPIARSGKVRNYPVVAVIAGLTLANLAIHLSLFERNAALLRAGTYGSVYLVVALMMIISGRLIPLFTRNRLKSEGQAGLVGTHRLVGAGAVGAAVTALVIDLVWPGNGVGAVFALIAAPLLLARQSGWQFRWTLRHPMLWILQLGHAWLALGFALHAAHLLWGPFLGAAALHAFTAGAMGSLILGVMPRVALGHSGNPIEPRPGTRLMFALVLSGAALRVLAGASLPALYQAPILISGALWTAAWLTFLVVYARFLVGTPASTTAVA